MSNPKIQSSNSIDQKFFNLEGPKQLQILPAWQEGTFEQGASGAPVVERENLPIQGAPPNTLNKDFFQETSDLIGKLSPRLKDKNPKIRSEAMRELAKLSEPWFVYAGSKVIDHSTRYGVRFCDLMEEKVIPLIYSIAKNPEESLPTRTIAIYLINSFSAHPRSSHKADVIPPRPLQEMLQSNDKNEVRTAVTILAGSSNSPNNLWFLIPFLNTNANSKRAFNLTDLIDLLKGEPLTQDDIEIQALVLQYLRDYRNQLTILGSPERKIIQSKASMKSPKTLRHLARKILPIPAQTSRLTSLDYGWPWPSLAITYGIGAFNVTREAGSSSYHLSNSLKADLGIGYNGAYQSSRNPNRIISPFVKASAAYAYDRLTKAEQQSAVNIHSVGGKVDLGLMDVPDDGQSRPLFGASISLGLGWAQYHFGNGKSSMGLQAGGVPALITSEQKLQMLRFTAGLNLDLGPKIVSLGYGFVLDSPLGDSSAQVGEERIPLRGIGHQVLISFDPLQLWFKLFRNELSLQVL